MKEQYKIDLRLIPADELIPHEETVPHLYDKLSRRMLHDNVQRDPIIVDESSRVVLDGMHRLGALKRMGAKLVVCSSVNYMSDEVKLFRWFRFVENPRVGLVSTVLSALGAMEESPFPGNAQAITTAGIVYKGRIHSIPRVSRVEEVSELTRRFDRLMRDAGAPLEFFDESSASPELLGGNYLALVTPRFGKEDVIRSGVERRLLPPKTTLHVLPVRPMGINYPIESLRNGDDVLDRILLSRPRRIIEPPSFYRGRLYREPVVVLE